MKIALNDVIYMKMVLNDVIYMKVVLNYIIYMKNCSELELLFYKNRGYLIFSV